MKVISKEKENNKYVCFNEENNKISKQDEHIIYHIETNNILEIICRLFNFDDKEKDLYNIIVNANIEDGIINKIKIAKLFCNNKLYSYSTFYRTYESLKNKNVIISYGNNIILNSKFDFTKNNLNNCKHIILDII